MTFGELLQAAINQKGLTTQDFPITPDRKYFLSPDDIPQGFRDRMDETLEIYSEKGMPLPFFHITPRAIRLPNGTIVDTNFLQDIQKNGTRKNLNVAGLVMRSPEGVQLATPTSILHRPEIFIDDIHLILERYARHGIRTNRTVHGQMRSDNFTNIGIPTMVMLMNTGRIKRGIDGDDHYVLLDPNPMGSVFGHIDINVIDPQNPQQIVDISSQVLADMSHAVSK